MAERHYGRQMRNVQNLPSDVLLSEWTEYRISHEGGKKVVRKPLEGERGKDERHVSGKTTRPAIAAWEAFQLLLS